MRLSPFNCYPLPPRLVSNPFFPGVCSDEIVLSTALTILEHGAHQCHHFVAIGPLFKLLQFVEKAQNEGKLSEIDALLGCGIYHIPSVTSRVLDHPVPSSCSYSFP